ncbi:hypothetical protein N9878_00630 [bacterium]|nr:hypothetical protein [bacterium]
MRDLNYLSRNQETVYDDDLLNIQMSEDEQWIPVLEELQYLRNKMDNLLEELGDLKVENSELQSYKRSDER